MANFHPTPRQWEILGCVSLLICSATLAGTLPAQQHEEARESEKLAKSIESNLAALEAARKKGSAGEELLARDRLLHTYLQGARDREAQKLFDKLPKLKSDDPDYFAGLYALETMTARFAVERRQWSEAAQLAVPPRGSHARFPGGRYAWTESNWHYARALGAVHIGNREDAQDELRHLAALQTTLARAGEKYWAERVRVQREIVAAWLSFTSGDASQSLEKMRAAADREDTMEKPSVTLGVIAPARELLADMLLELNRPMEAFNEYLAALNSEPDRFNALSGAAHAAEKLGDLKRARIYYTQLLALCVHADGDRPELQDAHAFLDEK